MSIYDDLTNLGPNDWPIANFDAAPTEAEWAAIEELESTGAFDAWSNGGSHR